MLMKVIYAFLNQTEDREMHANSNTNRNIYSTFFKIPVRFFVSSEIFVALKKTKLFCVDFINISHKPEVCSIRLSSKKQV